MKAEIDRFILSQGLFTQIKNDNVIIYHSQFDKNYYNDGLFAQLGVSYNETLTRAVPKRKSEFLVGRYCAKMALKQLNIENFTVCVGKNRAPIWPDGIKGAITHNSHHAMVAVNNNPDVLGIGIDVESVMSESTMNDIKDAIISGSEHLLLKQPNVCEATVLSLIFSFKESFFKAAYPSTGYYFDFDAVTINSLDFENKRFNLTVNQDLNPKVRPGKQCSGDFDFVDEQVMSLLVLV